MTIRLRIEPEKALVAGVLQIRPAFPQHHESQGSVLGDKLGRLIFGG